MTSTIPATVSPPLQAAPAVTELPMLSWRLPGVDGLRALACLMVFLCHAWDGAWPAAFAGRAIHAPPWTEAIARTFSSGVDLFMLLSGFCLFWPLCKSPEAIQRWQWRDYAYRRIRRIVPPYYMAIFFTLLLPQVLVLGTVIFQLIKTGGFADGAVITATLRNAHWQPISTPWEILTHLLFIHTLFIETWDKVTGAFWSLGLEMQFYIFFPLLIIAFRRWRIRALIAVIAVSILYRVFSGLRVYPEPEPWLSTIFFLGRWMQFAIGMLVALIVSDLYRRRVTLSSCSGSLLALAAIGLYVLLFSGLIDALPRPLRLIPWRDLFIAVAFGMLLVAATSTHSPVRRLLECRPFDRLGFISYSVFLIHQPTLWYFSELLKKKWGLVGFPHLLLSCTVGLTVVLTIAYGFFLLFERPFLSGKKRPLPVTPPAVSAASAVS